MFMPLSMARPGETVSVKQINGRDDTRHFLESLGFVVGNSVTVVSENSGNMIINVKDTRVAVSKSMASKILV